MEWLIDFINFVLTIMNIIWTISRKFQAMNDFIYGLNGKMKMGVISNINSGIWEAALRDNWVPNVDYISVILSYAVRCKKPERKIYEMAQQIAGVKAEEIYLSMIEKLI